MTGEEFTAKLKEVDAKISASENALSQGTTTTSSSTVSPAVAGNWWSNTNAMTISTVVLTFGLVVFVLATYLIRSGKDGEAVLRLFGTIMIVFLAVFLVVAGYSDTQIAPVMGLLGTVAGYLLARTTSGKATPPQTPDGASGPEKGK